MKKLWRNIETARLEDLLLATPYSRDLNINFGHGLDEDTFFKYLYAGRRRGGNIAFVENDIFDERVKNAIANNPFENVNVLYITGDYGCGITTYIHHLLYELKNEIGQYDLIDYEGYMRVEDSVINGIINLISNYNIDTVCEFFDAIAKYNQFETSNFSDIIPHLLTFSTMLRHHTHNRGHDLNNKTIYDYLHLFEKKFEQPLVYYRFLFIIEFFLLLLCRFAKEGKSPLVLVIDHSDRIEKEYSLLSIIVQFAEDCRYFFLENYNVENIVFNKSVNQVCKNTKFTIIFAAKLTTESRYKAVSVDKESMNTWTFVQLPENYYDPREIISKRVNYYLEIEGLRKDSIRGKLLQIKNLSQLAFRTRFFLRLFNGSVRFCIHTLCDIVTSYPEQMIQEIIKLNDNNKYVYDGASGYFLGLILDTFKRNGIYEAKLHLKPCLADGTVTLSRIVLTILREKGGRCSLLDMFFLLTPLGISTEKIVHTIWDLSERGRTIWRRLIIFEIDVPTIKLLIEQAIIFEKGIYDLEKYSELIMCAAGNVYLEVVLPHFEFMQSRHDLDCNIIKMHYTPLFANSSEEIICEKNGIVKYRFEQTIERVFRDVCDCCFNSFTFAEQVIAKEGWSREDYINYSYYNFHSNSADLSQVYKQSYESRIIFRHVGYLEHYRQYLVGKYEKEGFRKQNELSERIIKWIIRYLRLYQDSNKCYHTPMQDEAAERLIDKALMAQASIYSVINNG